MGLQWLGIYEETINDALETAEAAMTDAGCTRSALNSLYSNVSEAFTRGELDYSDITNSIMGYAYDYAKNEIENTISGVEVSYYINGDDTHLYVNGTEYFKGDDTITKLLNGVTIEGLNSTKCGNQPAVEVIFTTEDEELLFDILTAVQTHEDEYLSDVVLGEECDGQELYNRVWDENIGDFTFKAYLLSGGDIAYSVMLNLNDMWIDGEQRIYATVRDNSMLEREYDIREKIEMAVKGYEDMPKQCQKILDKYWGKPDKNIER